MKQKTCKNVRSTIFVLLLLLGAFFVVATDTVAADSEGDYTYTVSGGFATITGYTGTGGAITIPSTLGGYPTVAIGDYAFQDCTPLTSVTIPDSVISIGYGAFNDCPFLISVTIPDNVTSIGGYAFYACTSLISVTIPDNVTTIGNGAFTSCTSLTNVTIGKGVTSIGLYAFSFCSSLTSVTIPNNVTFIGDHAFGACSSLTSIDVNADNAHYASIDGVLYDKALTTLIQYPTGKSGGKFTIPNSVTTIEDYAFSDCFSLTSLIISNGVTSIGDYAFSDCSSLTSVTIPNNVTSIGNNAFSSCSSLTSVNIGSGVTTIEDYAFSDCSSLASITFSGLVAPTTVGANWILGTDARGHAYVASNFPAPGGDFYGLTMGAVISNSPTSDNTVLILVAVIAIAVILGAVLFVLRKRRSKK
ncbi:MAG: leucine-rich repeat domain-containing protein [Methanomassiliicoccales archaeon]|nr:leucine-rich repeat domain-containing protein [Methanomassiliicoccales archaeon]